MTTTMQKQRYGIVGVFNDREQGKTTYAVNHVLKSVRLRVEYDEAFTNIHIGPMVDERGSHYGEPNITFVNYAEIIKLHRPTINGVPRALLLLDQVSNYIDARASNTKLNIEFSKFIRESRQHGLDIIYTTWMRSEVDKRLEPFTPLMISAHRSEKGFIYKRLDRSDAKHVRRLPDEFMPWSIAKDVWHYFDSGELIEDPTIPGAKQ